MRTLIVFLIGLFIGLLFCGAVQAQLVCGPRTAVLASLQKLYNEKPLHIALVSNGQVLEVVASPNGSTFTIVLTKPSGESCVMAAGEHWEKVVPKVKGPKT